MLYQIEKNTITKELSAQLSNSLKDSVSFFKTVYVNQITEDLRFVENSYVLNSFLSSEKADILLNKSLMEQFFIYFTDRPNGKYLSTRYIDSTGEEKVITCGNKRLKTYSSLAAFSSTDVLYSKIFALFKKLKFHSFSKE